MPARVGPVFAGALLTVVAAGPPASAAADHPPFMDACGECHMVFPAPMLPRASWIAILAGLDNHFGEVATIPPDQLEAIRDYLTLHAADSPNATARDRHYMAALPSDAAPLRITRTPWWRQMHADFDFEGVKRTKVKTAANCPACHEDGLR